MKHTSTIDDFSLLRRLARGIAALGCVVAISLTAEADETEVPIPKPAKTSAVKGQPLDIELSSIARTRASTVEFLIRDHPRSGKLGRMISLPKDRTKATITYTADRGTAATTDSFTFAVRYYPGGRFSKEVKVEIELEESEPFITVTAEADFGNVMLGDSEVKELFLQNSGKAAYQRKLELPAPWSISVPVNGFVSLPVGGTTSIKVRFSPKAAESYEYPLTINPNPGGSARLAGTGFAPFAVKTSEIYLTWEKNSRARIGEIQLDVISPKVMPVVIRSGDQRLLVDGGINQMMVPGKTFATRIYLPASDSEAYQGTVEIAAGAFKLPVTVAAGAPPAYVEVDTGSPTGERVIDFGTLEPGAITQKGFVVSNVGGGDTKVRFESDEPFQVLAAGGSSTLSPGENEAFAIRFRAPEGEQHVFDNVLNITAETGQMVQVRLKAVTQLPAGSAAGLPSAFPQTLSPGNSIPLSADPDRPPSRPDRLSPGDRPPGTPDLPEGVTEREQLEALRSPLGFVTLPLIEREISPDVPPVAEIGMAFEDHGHHHVTVSWSTPRDDLVRFELERRGNRKNPESLAIESVWVPYHDVEYKLENGRMFATIRGLNPYELSEFRVFTLGGEGKVSRPVAFVSDTKPLMDWTWIYISLATILVIAVGAATWRIMTARRIESEGFLEFG